MTRTTRQLPQRADFHVGETESINAFTALFSDPMFLVRDTRGDDYGADLEIEALDNGNVTNARAQVQLKATRSKPNIDGSISYPINVKNIEYLRVTPSALYILYSRDQKTLFYRFVQDVHAELERSHPSWELQAKVTVRFDSVLTLDVVRQIHARLLTWLHDIYEKSSSITSTKRVNLGEPFNRFHMLQARNLDLSLAVGPFAMKEGTGQAYVLRSARAWSISAMHKLET